MVHINRQPLSQFGKALKELDVRLIHARTPQAKGRVERRRFSVKALSAEDLHRAIPEAVELDKIFSIKSNRVLRNDFTVMHEGKTLRYRKIERRPKKIEPPRKARAPYILSKDNPWRNFRLPGSFPQLKQTETFLNQKYSSRLCLGVTL